MADMCTYELVLVGRDSGEYGFLKNEGLERLTLQVVNGVAVSTVRASHQVNTWLVLVHRVQDQLKFVTTIELINL